MKSKLFLLLLTVLPVLSFAQGASLTIFSEDGDKFILYLNGQQQNNISQTNLRLDGLSQPYYKARIVFDDPAKAAIDKNIPVNDPSTNVPADVVYKIKNKDGEMKLRYFSAQPVQQNYTPPADVYVVHYGQPDMQQSTVSRTTVTMTNTVNPNSNISVNGGGMNMNINIQDPNATGNTVTQTTTTTSYSTTTNENAGYNQASHREEHHRSRGCEYPMEWGNFKSAKETVAKESFEDTKLSTAKSILNANCFNTDQVMQICKLFSFEASKLDFAKFAYAKTTDQANYFKVNNVFDFDASKTELNNYVSNGGH